MVLNLSNQKEYLGFSSKIGVTQFGAPEYWKASIMEFKHKAEHTVNDKRFGFEM